MAVFEIMGITNGMLLFLSGMAFVVFSVFYGLCVGLTSGRRRRRLEEKMKEKY